MKRYIKLFLPLIAAIAFVACDDDDKNLPDVTFNIEIENAQRVDGTLYIVQGDTLEVKSITVTNNEAGKEAFITSASYYWDYNYVFSSVIPPYGFSFYVGKNTPVGRHNLDIECPVYAVDKEAAVAISSFKVKVVASIEEIPATGVKTFSVRPSTSSND